MLAREVPIDGSDICGKYKFKANIADNNYIGSFDLYDRGGHLEIWSFGIYGKYRGRGFGQQMMREAIEIAKNRKIVLYVLKENKPAIHVYEKCGFKISGKYMCDTAWVMTYVGDEHAEEKRCVAL